MASTIPSSEPATLVAGDTIAWTRELSDYPASTWTLAYRLINAANTIDITASADGDTHSVAVSAAVSATYQPGVYTWQAYVTAGAARYTVGSGRIEIKPDLAAQQGGFDTRSEARQILEALREGYKTMTLAGSGHVFEYQIAGRVMRYHKPADILEAIRYWSVEVARENNGGFRMLARFH